MAKLLKWQQREKDRISKMSNEEFYSYFLGEIQPDDYDGGFSNRGFWYAQNAQHEMNKRLDESDFFKEKGYIKKRDNYSQLKGKVS